MTSSQPLDLRLPTPGGYNDPERAGLDAKSVFDGMTEHLFFTLGKLAPTASRHDLYMALSYAVRDRLMMRYLATTEAMRAHPQKSVAYLSAEFLIGPQLNNNLLNLGIQQEAEAALRNFGIESLQQILDVEEEPGLGTAAKLLSPGLEIAILLMVIGTTFLAPVLLRLVLKDKPPEDGNEVSEEFAADPLAGAS